eukprot:CAMPEP_0119151738 /NCGR_PEP_ID=MMETSP1310-20130426/46733_1 /TAXON_ID=464262 /ORGANISM="Genus nov. species nov., Strain RCC2339" /LENGTH=819 /DNA_ID=CAMNT_0007144043 /DNA_START=62 /DNA_END=2518 /DNA_ORIENTATION=+
MLGTILLGLVLTALVDACGVTTHNYVAHRALHRLSTSGEFGAFNDLIQRHQGSFQAGVAFPDFGYSCFLKGKVGVDLPEMSEEAHWPPFLNASISYLHSTYPTPWNLQAERYVAFLLGQTAHATADILWHDLRSVYETTKQGYIEAMADVEVGSFSTAHTLADTGGEFRVAATAVQGMVWIEHEWFIPSDDLANVYALMGYPRPSPDTITACQAELFLEVQGIWLLSSRLKLVGQLLNHHYSMQSAFQTGLFESYFLGGVEDMALWVAECWPFVFGFLDQPATPRGRWCKVLSLEGWENTSLAIRQERTQRKQALHMEVRQILASLDVWAPRELVRATPDSTGGVTLSLVAGEMARRLLPTAQAVVLNQKLVEEDQDEGASSPLGDCVAASALPLTVSSAVPYSYTGHSMVGADLNLDGFDDLLIGAPGWQSPGGASSGRVLVVWGGRVPTAGHVRAEDEHHVTVLSPPGPGLQQFGWAVAVIDVNLDGLPDVCVSAPRRGGANLDYDGRVYVYLGANSSGEVHPDPAQLITIRGGSHLFENLGSSLSAVMVEGRSFLRIGSPMASDPSNPGVHQAGTLADFPASSALEAGHAYDALPYVKSTGDEDYSWLGTSSTASGYVGVPAAGGARGAVTLGATAGSGKITGVTSHGYFGTALATGRIWGGSDEALLASAPFADTNDTHVKQGGILYAINITAQSLGGVPVGAVPVDALDVVFKIQGDGSFALLGSGVLAADVSGDGAPDVLTTAPGRSHPGRGAHRGGAAYAFFSETMPRGGTTVEYPSNVAQYCVVGDTQEAQLGFAQAVLDIDGDGTLDWAL